MDKYLKKIIKDNNDILKNCKINKINSGFRNLVYNVNNLYIIKICIDKTNEKRFINEINFYLKNKNNKYIPKLYKYYISKDEQEYSYIIIEKINGNTLYYVWHKFEEERRKEVIKEISLIMKSIHDNVEKKYDWGLFIKKKLINNLNKCNNIFTNIEINKLIYIIENCYKYLNSEYFRLVHADIHFDNIILTENNDLKIIDFETSLSAPIDYELDIFLKMCKNPLKYSNKETEKLIKIKDYINIPKYLKEYYPEIFNFEYYEIRHSIYDLESNLRLLVRFSNDKELKNIILNIIDRLIEMIN